MYGETVLEMTIANIYSYENSGKPVALERYSKQNNALVVFINKEHCKFDKFITWDVTVLLNFGKGNNHIGVTVNPKAYYFLFGFVLSNIYL